MPGVSHLIRRHELPNPISNQHFGNDAVEFTRVLVNGGLSVALVLLGGFFAGLTLALMGQDEITLRVLSTSGTGRQKTDAQKVLSLLNKGKHWVLVTLVLGNVIVNEALPIVLNGEMAGHGGWIAIFISTGLVVIFGEIIPQSVCSKYGLAIGASSSSLVLVMMYILSPVGYPIARLLDHLLGTYFDRKFSREGLKTLIMLHEAPLYLPTGVHTNPDRLHPLETASICNLLSTVSTKVSDIMVPSKAIFKLSADMHLDEMTRYDILKSGFSKIPVYQEGCSEKFLGLLHVKHLIATGFQEQDARLSDVSLGTMRTLSPSMSLTEALGLFKSREMSMVAVTEGGRSDGQVLGILTYRDVMEAAIGNEMQTC